MIIKNQYSGVFNLLKRYWKIYGGSNALICSPYVHISLVLTLITSHYWLNYSWWSQPISILPSLLGFTLGGFAVFLGFGDEKFKALIAGKTPESQSTESPYLGISVTFLHFVLLQLFALIWAIVASTVHFHPPSWLGCSSSFFIRLDPISSAIGYFLYLYSLCSAIAAALSIFRLATIFDKYITEDKKKTAEAEAKLNPVK